MASPTALIYHPTTTHLLRYTSTVVGRDKLLRTLQYFSRFYAWYLYRTNNPASSIAPFEAIKKQFGLARKLLRIGKNIEHLKAAAIAADSKAAHGDAFLKYTTVGRQLGYAGYLSFDMLTYPDAAGIKKWEGAKRAGREAYKAWFAGLACSAIQGVYVLYRLREREARLLGPAAGEKGAEDVVERKRIERERRAVQLQLLSDVCDLTVPTSALGWVGFDDGFVGLAGTVSSLIGVYGAWKKTAAY